MSNTFTIFKNGAPVRTVTCPPNELALQLLPGEEAQPGDMLPMPVIADVIDEE